VFGRVKLERLRRGIENRSEGGTYQGNRALDHAGVKVQAFRAGVITGAIAAAAIRDISRLSAGIGTRRRVQRRGAAARGTGLIQNLSEGRGPSGHKGDQYRIAAKSS
jgi:hypothetical protein